MSNLEFSYIAIHPGEVLKEELESRGISQKDFAKAIKDDLKIEKAGDLPEAIGQMIVLNLNSFNLDEMKKVFAEYPEWMMNVISLEDGKSYIYFGGNDAKQRLEKLFGITATQDNLLVLDNFLLRKQIMKMARDAA